jgi:hypothetical protein
MWYTIGNIGIAVYPRSRIRVLNRQALLAGEGNPVKLLLKLSGGPAQVTPPG